MDDLDPHYCTRCRKQIPRRVSEVRGVCDDCFVAPEAAATARGDGQPACPRCGSANVAREWVIGIGAWFMFALWQVVRWGFWLVFWWSTWWSSLFEPDADGGAHPGATLKYRCRRCRQSWKAI